MDSTKADINSFTRAFCGKHSNLMNALKFFENNPQMLQSYFWRNLLRCAFSQVWEEPVIEIDEDGNEVKKVKLHHIIENHTDEAFLKYFQKWCSVALGKVRRAIRTKSRMPTRPLIIRIKLIKALQLQNSFWILQHNSKQLQTKRLL